MIDIVLAVSPIAGGVLPSTRTVDIFFIARSRQQIRVAGGNWIGVLASGNRRISDIDVAVGALRIVTEASLGVIDRISLLGRINRASSRTPLPALIADVGWVVKIVELDELFRQGMLIRRDEFGELGEVRVAIAGRQIAKDLVVGTVLFDDVDYVLDVLAQLS